MSYSYSLPMEAAFSAELHERQAVALREIAARFPDARLKSDGLMYASVPIEDCEIEPAFIMTGFTQSDPGPAFAFFVEVAGTKIYREGKEGLATVIQRLKKSPALYEAFVATVKGLP